MANTADDTARLLVSIEATQAKFEKQMAVIARAAAKSAKTAEDNFQRANDNIGRGFDKGGRDAERALGRSRAAAQTLSFQLNDIATQLASGTSPFTVMAQQGGQVAQALNSAGGLRGAFAAFGGAVTGLLNPVGLLSIALIGVTGYAAQYFAEWVKGGEASADEIEKQNQLIQKVADKFGDTMPALKAYADEMERAADAATKIEAAKIFAERQYSGAKAAQNVLLPDFAAVRTDLQQLGVDAVIIDDLQAAWDNLSDKMAKNEATSDDVTAVQSRLFTLLGVTGLESVGALAGQMAVLAEQTGKASDKSKEADQQAKNLATGMDNAKGIAVFLAQELTAIGPAGVTAFAEIAKAIGGNLIPGLDTALEKLREIKSQVDAAYQSLYSNNPLGGLSPVLSGGGQFLNTDGNPLLAGGLSPQTAAAYQSAGASAAAEMVKGFEGFITKAKWDVNAYRVGFGSDTVTRANGEIERVTKDTVVTLEDAQRDLSRRLVEFQSGIKQAIGVDTWNSLNEAQKAAISSIAYNYGELPKRIVDAINSGGGPQAVAQAIANLAGDNKGVNAGRRRKEAQAYLSGSGLSLAGAGISKGRRFKESMEDVRARIDLLNAEFAAQTRVSGAVNDYGYAVEKARIKQKLLNDAKRAEIEVTPTLAAEIDRLAANYAKAATQTDQFRASQKRARAAAAEVANLGREFFGGFVQDLLAGKDASEALANALTNLASRIADLALDSLFSGLFGSASGGSGKGLIGDLFGFSGGGYTGRGAKNEPAGVVHKGEYVFSKRAVEKIGAGNLEAMHRNLNGYANGGLVAAPTPPAIPRRVAAASSSSSMKVDVGVRVDNNGNLQAYVHRVSRGEVDRYDRQRAPGTAIKAVQQYQVRGA